MGIGDLPLMSMLKTRMRWHSQRQAVLAENVANADTPGFRARDLRQLDIQPRSRPLAAPDGTSPTRVAGVTPPGAIARTDPGHIGPGPIGPTNAQDARRIGTFETTPRGNSVVLEDEMIKIGQNAQDFQAAATLYQRSMGLLRTAIGRRGG